MNSDANPSTVPSRKRSRKARESTGKLTVREIVEKKDGYSWTTFLVQGWRTPDGRHGRKKFKSRVEAESFIALKSVEQVNSKTVLNSVVTRLSTAQVHEAEGAFSRLGSRYSLGQAVEYFLRHFAQPADPISLEKAIDAFLDDRRHEGTRVKFLVGMRNTINRFSAFATLRALPTDLQSQIEPTRLTIEAARAASLAEVISRIDIALRPTVRRVAERVARVHELLQQTLDSAVRDAIIAARDQIEKQRAPKDSCIAKAMLAAFPNAKIPDVHEITTEDVEAFLRSLRSRDGRTAVRKTWNTTRADLHSFFGWCASKQRRFCAENVASGTVKYKLARGVPHVLTVQQARELMA